MRGITVDEFLRYGSTDVIDIRSEQSYNNNHIPGSINIPYSKLLANPSNYLEKGKKYYIYCQKGITSLKLCNYLLSLGYNVVNIIGGYEEWILKR